VYSKTDKEVDIRLSQYLMSSERAFGMMYNSKLILIQAHPGLVQPQDPHNGAGVEQIGAGNQGGTLYLYYGHFWDAVPEFFLFPANIKYDVGWKLWLAGMREYRTEGQNGAVINSAIMPF
jgi:hypothetical protein